MISQQYKNRTAQDIADRAFKVLLNASIELAIADKKVERNKVCISTEVKTDLDNITLIQLLDEKGEVIASRETNLSAITSLFTEFKFEFEVI